MLAVVKRTLFLNVQSVRFITVVVFILQEGGESAAILKIKESMQEEAKRFEKEGEHADYYLSQW